MIIQIAIDINEGITPPEKYISLLTTLLTDENFEGIDDLSEYLFLATNSVQLVGNNNEA